MSSKLSILLASMSRATAIAFGVSILFSLHCAKNSVFGVNDDPAMSWFVSNWYHQSDRVPFLPFSSLIIGAILWGLFGLAPNIDWYSCYLYLILTLSLSSILFSAFNTFLAPIFRQFKNDLLSSLVFLGTIGVLLWIVQPSYYEPSFTEVSAVSGIAALVMILSRVVELYFSDQEWEIENDEPHGATGRSIVSHCLIIGFACVAAWIRFDTVKLLVLLVLPTTTVFLFSRLFRGRSAFVDFSSRISHCCKAIVFCLESSVMRSLLIIFSIICFTQLGETLVYNLNPEWESYREYNEHRGLLFGTPRETVEPSISNAIGTVGWSRNDLELFQQALFIDRQTYSLEVIERLDQILPNIVAWSGGTSILQRYSWSAFLEVFPRIKETLFPTTVHLLVLGAFILLVRGKSACFQMLIIVSSSLLLIYLINFQRLPRHVSRSVHMFVYVALLMVFLADLRQRVHQAKTMLAIKAWVSIFVLIGILIPLFDVMIARAEHASGRRATFVQSTRRFFESVTAVPNSVVFAVTAPDRSCTVDCLVPFFAPTIFFERNVSLLLHGWGLFNPINEQLLNEQGVRSSFREMVDHPRVLFLLSKWYEDRVVEFMKEHFGEKVCFVVVFPLGIAPKEGASLLPLKALRHC